MLDLKIIRENPDFVESQLARRHGGFSIQDPKAVDLRQREAQAELEQLNWRKNEISELFGDRQGLQGRNGSIARRNQGN